jgi:hypothetical protein
LKRRARTEGIEDGTSEAAEDLSSHIDSTSNMLVSSEAFFSLALKLQQLLYNEDNADVKNIKRI